MPVTKTLILKVTTEKPISAEEIVEAFDEVLGSDNGADILSDMIDDDGLDWEWYFDGNKIG